MALKWWLGGGPAIRAGGGTSRQLRVGSFLQFAVFFLCEFCSLEQTCISRAVTAGVQDSRAGETARWQELEQGLLNKSPDKHILQPCSKSSALQRECRDWPSFVSLDLQLTAQSKAPASACKLTGAGSLDAFGVLRMHLGKTVQFAQILPCGTCRLEQTCINRAVSAGIVLRVCREFSVPIFLC